MSKRPLGEIQNNGFLNEDKTHLKSSITTVNHGRLSVSPYRLPGHGCSNRRRSASPQVSFTPSPRAHRTPHGQGTPRTSKAPRSPHTPCASGSPRPTWDSPLHVTGVKMTLTAPKTEVRKLVLSPLAASSKPKKSTKGGKKISKSQKENKKSAEALGQSKKVVKNKSSTENVKVTDNPEENKPADDFEENESVELYPIITSNLKLTEELSEESEKTAVLDECSKVTEPETKKKHKKNVNALKDITNSPPVEIKDDAEPSVESKKGIPEFQMILDVNDDNKENKEPNVENWNNNEQNKRRTQAEEDILAQIRNEHQTMEQIFGSRILKLNAARSMYHERGLAGLTSYLDKLQDSTTMVDLVPFLTKCLRTDPSALVHVGILLYSALDLLTSNFEDYISKGLDLLTLIIEKTQNAAEPERNEDIHCVCSMLKTTEILHGLKMKDVNGKLSDKVHKLKEILL